jgi:hypothetical protein
MEIQTLDPLEIPKSLSYLICFFDNFNILKLRQLLPQDSQRRSKYNEVLGSDKDYIYNGIPSTTGVVATASSPAKGCRGDKSHTPRWKRAHETSGEALLYTLPESRSLPCADKGTKTHGTAFAVRIFPKHTAKGARLIFTR